ncbi:MAG: FAD-dependent oxidoreductase, partial [Candidatus Cryptobacteroides sp.]
MNGRRTFLKQMGAVAVAAAVPDLLTARTKPEKGTLPGRNISLDSSWDVIVVGGGPSGCTAAISAARQGAKTLLIEAMGQLGGMGTAGMVPAWCPFSDGEKIIYRGLAETVF